MSSLRAHGVSFAFSDAVSLLSGVEFHLSPGWTGLVGANGAGKSTLLRLLSGELKPTGGHFQHEPPSPLLRLCPQSVEDADARHHRLRRVLGLRCRGGCSGSSAWTPGALERWPTLSPGERKRWQIGAALASRAGRAAARRAHQPPGRRGARLAPLRAAPLPGHWRRRVPRSNAAGGADHLHAARPRGRGPAVARRLLRRRSSAGRPSARGSNAARQQAQETHRRVAQQLDQARREQQSASLARNAGRRMKDKNDNDARSMGAKVVAGWAEARHGRKVGVLRREAERAAEAIGEFQVDKTVGRSVFVDYVRSPNPWLFTLENHRLRAGEVELLGAGDALGGPGEPHPHRGPQRRREDDAAASAAGARPGAAGADPLPAPGRERGRGLGGAGGGGGAASRANVDVCCPWWRRWAWIRSSCWPRSSPHRARCASC